MSDDDIEAQHKFFELTKTIRVDLKQFRDPLVDALQEEIRQKDRLILQLEEKNDNMYDPISGEFIGPR